MTCADLEGLLCDYVDGTLDDEQRALVEGHLAECAACTALVRDGAAALAFLEQAPDVEPPDALVTRLLFQVPTAHAAGRRRTGLRALLIRWMEPVLQPRFAMGMAMTILSFSLLSRFVGIPDRPLRPSDLSPANVLEAVYLRGCRAWDEAVKYYDSLRLVYEIQTRLREWTQEEEQERRSVSEGAPPEPSGLEVPPAQLGGTGESGGRR
jgi:hypothetical protein